MAYITNKKRESLIHKINQSYGLRKTLLLLEVVGLIAFIVVTFISFYFTEKEGPTSSWSWFKGEGKDITNLSNLGIGMVVFAAILAILGIISVILIFSIKSPKGVRAQVKELESAAISGKKIKSGERSTDIMKSRTTLPGNKKK